MRPSMAYPSRRKSFPFYKILTPRDLDAVVTYVRSVPPVRNEVQPSVYKASMHVELVPGAEKPFEEMRRSSGRLLKEYRAMDALLNRRWPVKCGSAARLGCPSSNPGAGLLANR